MTDALAYFDKKSLSYTYENDGHSDTNYFEGNIRTTETESRGTLRENITIAGLRDGIYMISWQDAEMGLIAQVVDFPKKRIVAAVPVEGKVEIWHAKITAFVDGKV